MTHSITVESLAVYAGSTRLMGPVSFAVSPGDTLVIMGETGAGKSLIAQAILGTLPVHCEPKVRSRSMAAASIPCHLRSARPCGATNWPLCHRSRGGHWTR